MMLPALVDAATGHRDWQGFCGSSGLTLVHSALTDLTTTWAAT